MSVGDGRREGREPFSMPPRSLTRALPPAALQLYAYLDDVQQDNGHPVKGYRKAAKDLGWQHRTVQHWAEYLAGLGILELGGGSRQARTMTVIHNPARGRVAEGVRLPESAPPSGSQRRSYTSKLARETRQLDEGTGAHNAPQLARDAHQQLARLTRQTGALDAPRPSSSPKESESSQALTARGSGEQPENAAEVAESQISALTCCCESPHYDANGDPIYCDECKPFDALEQARLVDAERLSCSHGPYGSCWRCVNVPKRYPERKPVPEPAEGWNAPMTDAEVLELGFSHRDETGWVPDPRRFRR